MIPKKIHYLWLSEVKPPNIVACLQTWKIHLKDYEIIEWNKSNFPYNDFLWTREAFSVQKWAFVTDYFRLWVLKNYGGIYLDADVVVTSSFDNFLNNKMFIGTELSCQFGPHVIGAKKEHPFIIECLNYYSDRNFIQNGEYQQKVIIPHIMTRIFMEKYDYRGKIVRFDNIPVKIKDITIYNDTFFTVNVFNGCNICYHNCVGSWRDDDSENLPSTFTFMKVYFRKYLFTFDLNEKRILKYIMLLAPTFLTSLYYDWRMNIKNNKSVKKVNLKHK